MCTGASGRGMSGPSGTLPAPAEQSHSPRASRGSTPLSQHVRLRNSGGGGVHFFDPPPHLPQNLKKVGVKWGGLGGSGPKTHWGMRLLDKTMILQGVKLTHVHCGTGVQAGGHVWRGVEENRGRGEIRCPANLKAQSATHAPGRARPGSLWGQ